MILLIVNDAVLEAQTMQRDIEWEQYGIDKVYTAFSADEARSVIQSQTVDLLLCDIEMPGESGLSLIRWIVENQYDIDCILLTCHADFTYAQEAVSLNCHEYLLLPAKYSQIGECVKRVCGVRMKRKEGEELQMYGRSWLKERQPEPENARSPKESVEECVQYIFDHIDDEEMSITSIADHFYMNPIYLNRIFKKEKGITLNQFMIQERMRLAAHYLQEPGVSAVNAALKVGYSNYSYFSTTFKKIYQCTPTQYMQKYQ